MLIIKYEFHLSTIKYSFLSESCHWTEFVRRTSTQKVQKIKICTT